MSQDTTHQVHLPAAVLFVFSVILLIVYGFLYTEYSDNQKKMKMIKIILLMLEVIGVGASAAWYLARI